MVVVVEQCSQYIYSSIMAYLNNDVLNRITNMNTTDNTDDDDNDDIWFPQPLPCPTLQPTISSAVQEDNTSYAAPILIVALFAIIALVFSIRRGDRKDKKQFAKVMLREDESGEDESGECRDTQGAQHTHMTMQAVVRLNGESILLKSSTEDKDF